MNLERIRSCRGASPFYFPQIFRLTVYPRPRLPADSALAEQRGIGVLVGPGAAGIAGFGVGGATLCCHGYDSSTGG